MAVRSPANAEDMGRNRARRARRRTCAVPQAVLSVFPSAPAVRAPPALPSLIAGHAAAVPSTRRERNARTPGALSRGSRDEGRRHEEENGGHSYFCPLSNDDSQLIYNNRALRCRLRLTVKDVCEEPQMFVDTLRKRAARATQQRIFAHSGS